MPDSVPPSSAAPSEKRSTGRVEVVWAVDCETEDTFLYASITNISDMGIFVRTETPLAVGTYLRLRFSPRDGAETWQMMGRVQWVNLVRPFGDNINPGMGVMFLGLSPEERERLVELVHTIAYLREGATES
ncbi:MAG: TIGR02266 family protein [Deltaproteobacteria bacterium]|nr:TIGR02266 family protein [Deltaproteobacteria bacterium]